MFNEELTRDWPVEATETVLGTFGFDRTLFGKAKDRRWWEEFRQNTMRDVLTEIG